MDPTLAIALALLLPAGPLAYGLYRVYFKHGINAGAFASVCEKLLLAGNTGRFEKLLAAAGNVPLVTLVTLVWRKRNPPAMTLPDFDGYRQAGAPPTYLERLRPVIAPDVEAVRRQLGRAPWWTLSGLLPLPALALLLKGPSLEAPWIIAGVMALLCGRAFVSAQSQRNQVNRTLERLVPLFEPHANAQP